MPANHLLRELFDSSISKDQIVRTIRSLYEEERSIRKDHEKELVSELYKVTSFDWGGLHQNALERTIVNNYVKKIHSYGVLTEKIDTDLFVSMKSYVVSSWYNHWTSIIIEDIFKDHPNVLPTVGLVKKIDFFIRDVPFDLKVTYLPEGYIRARRNALGLPSEISQLRASARELQIHFDNNLTESKLLEDLWTKLNDNPSPSAQQLIRSLYEVRVNILNECIEDPRRLMVWLYENQGLRRFDAANRLFLILVNTNNFFASWKLKRSRELLVDRINQHLDSIVKTQVSTSHFTGMDRSTTQLPT